MLSPFLLTPGHEQLRLRSLALQNQTRWQRFLSPYGTAYLPLLVGTVICLLPFAMSDSTTNLSNATMIFLLLFAWASFITALVEHCTLYVRARGRMLAFLVGLLFLRAPIFLEDDGGLPQEAYLYLSPFGWMDDGVLDAVRANLGVYLTQLFGVAAAAFLLQIWTNKQRKKIDQAQRARINEVLGLSALSTTLASPLPFHSE